ncbi:RNA methyltransferase [Candidatus Woesearchaeota archaeon]|nr:RNA methyltransferase [Candidatus Woesearchaeota archaeon]
MKAQFKAAVATHPGFEDIAALEVKELVGAKATIAAGERVAFQTKNLNDLCKLCYLSQSANSVFLLPQKAPINPFEMGKREYEVFGSNGGISGSLSYLMLRVSGYTGRESLFDPFTRSGTIAIEAALFSSGFPVNRYRKDSLASAFSKLPQFSKADFSEFFAAAEKEASSAAKKRVRSSKPKILSSSPSMQHVRFAEKNAKIAGVNKIIRFSRLDIEWLDAKLDERSIDLVVSYPPQFKNSNDKFAAVENEKLHKMYVEFFFHADYFLKKGGSIVFLLKNKAAVAAIAANHKFKPKVMRKFKVGSEDFELVSFTKL